MASFTKVSTRLRREGRRSTFSGNATRYLDCKTSKQSGQQKDNDGDDDHRYRLGKSVHHRRDLIIDLIEHI
jgi:hypothetical protein